MSTPTVLPAAALARVAPAPAATSYLRSGLARGGLCLLPVALAWPAAGVAGDPLAAVPWPVPVGALATAWCLLALLVALGRPRGGGGAAAAALAGTGIVAAAWSVLLALAPAAVAGPDRAAGYLVSLPVLVLAGAVAAAVAGRSEPALLRWSTPVPLVALAAAAGWLPEPATGPLLLAAVAVPVARGFAPAMGQLRNRSRELRWPERAEWRRAAGYLALAASQAGLVILVWRAGEAVFPAAGPAPSLVPLLAVLVGIEGWIGWHLARTVTGLTSHDDRDRHHHYVRRVGWATLAGLLPPLAAGAALAGAGYRLPYGLSAHPDATALPVLLAVGALLVGVVALGGLLAARGRPGLATVVTAGPVVPVVVAPASLLLALLMSLFVTYLAGLLLAAHVLFDPYPRSGELR